MTRSLALLISLSGPTGVSAHTPARASVAPSHVAVWTDRVAVPYASGEAVRVAFRTAQDDYVTILRVDTDGRVRVLFPREPWEANVAQGGREYVVAGPSGSSAFRIDDYPGVGYIFAVSAPDPFAYDAIASGDHWDYRAIADGRIRGDPYVALTALARRIVRPGSNDWDYDLVPYYVEQHYDYPRFLCYDCHSYVSYPFWNPYEESCTRFRIVMRDDPYPDRSYGGARVVFGRPVRPGPRFIMKDRRGSEPFLSHVPGQALGSRLSPRPRAERPRGEALAPPGQIGRDRGERPEWPRTAAADRRARVGAGDRPSPADRAALRATRAPPHPNTPPPNRGAPPGAAARQHPESHAAPRAAPHAPPPREPPPHRQP